PEQQRTDIGQVHHRRHDQAAREQLRQVPADRAYQWIERESYRVAQHEAPLARALGAGITVKQLPDSPQSALVRHRRSTARGALSAAAGASGEDPEAGRRDAQPRHSNRDRSRDPTGGPATASAAVGPDISVSEHSYGFRPGRSAHQAVAQAQAYVI